MTPHAASLAAFHSEAGGLVELVVVRPSDAMDILADMLAGDDQALDVMRALTAASRSVEEARRKRRPMLCSCCPRALQGSGFSFGLVMPMRDNPSNCMALGICYRCATEREAVRAKATEALRRMWPDLRPVTPTHASGGRA